MGQDNTPVLAADIGGTSARFALFGQDDILAPIGPGALVVLRTADYSSFQELVDAALGRLGHPKIRAAVLAVAGPVERGRFCRPPNIAYCFDLDRLARGILPDRALLVNDFIAQAHGCRLLGKLFSNHNVPSVQEAAFSSPKEHILTVFPGRMDPTLTQAVVGPGTGLGKAALAPDGRGGFVICASEGGHAAFAFNGSPEENDLQRFVLETLGEPYVRVESMISGAGLALLHRSLTGQPASPADAEAALTPDSPVTAWFARFLGRICRDYVLDVLATGGLFLSGGVAARNPMLLAHEAFQEEFCLSATHAELLAKVPVRLVTDQLIGLRGAAALASGLP